MPLDATDPPKPSPTTRRVIVYRVRSGRDGATVAEVRLNQTLAEYEAINEFLRRVTGYFYWPPALAVECEDATDEGEGDAGPAGGGDGQEAQGRAVAGQGQEEGPPQE